MKLVPENIYLKTCSIGKMLLAFALLHFVLQGQTCLLLQVFLDQSIIKEINSEYSLEGLMLKLKLQYFGHLMRRADSLEKTLIWERLRVEREGGSRG